MTPTTIHFRDYTHHIVKGMYRDSIEKISRLIAKQVAKMPMATNSAIALSTSKEFLTNYIFYNKEGEKEMLKG